MTARSWPKLPDQAYSPDDPMPECVMVEGWGSYGRRTDGLYANTERYADDVWIGCCHTFDSLRQLGNVTEIKS